MFKDWQTQRMGFSHGLAVLTTEVSLEHGQASLSGCCLCMFLVKQLQQRSVGPAKLNGFTVFPSRESLPAPVRSTHYRRFESPVTSGSNCQFAEDTPDRGACHAPPSGFSQPSADGGTLSANTSSVNMTREKRWIGAAKDGLKKTALPGSSSNKL